MKRIPFLILVFMLTTGFFKSALEECADKSIQMFHITPSAEWKKKEKSANRKVSDKAEIKQIKKTCSGEGWLKCGETKDLLKRWQIEELNRSYIEVKVRDIPKSEQQRVFNKFLKQSLKKKIQNTEYEKNYEGCIYFKKSKPELFKAKYD